MRKYFNLLTAVFFILPVFMLIACDSNNNGEPEFDTASSINITMVNNSSDANLHSVVIFQKNLDSDTNEKIVAWRIMPDLGKESSWIFTFPRSIQIGAEDFYGDKTGLFEAFDGDHFTYKVDVTGPVLILDDDKNNPGHIMLNNNTGEPISASIYRDGKLLSTQTEILDEQTVSFNFNEEIYFGIYSSGELNEGELVDFVNFSYAVKFDFSYVNSATVTVTGNFLDGFVVEMAEE